MGFYVLNHKAISIIQDTLIIMNANGKSMRKKDCHFQKKRL